MVMKSLQNLPRECGCHRRLNADTAVAGQFQARTTQIDTSNETQEIQFNTFDPTNLDACIAPEIDLQACAAIGPPRIDAIAEITADCIWGQRHAKLRHRAQDRRDEAVAVWSRPDP